jgi:hypothetical protein
MYLSFMLMVQNLIPRIPLYTGGIAVTSDDDNLSTGLDLISRDFDASSPRLLGDAQ